MPTIAMRGNCQHQLALLLRNNNCVVIRESSSPQNKDTTRRPGKLPSASGVVPYGPKPSLTNPTREKYLPRRHQHENVHIQIDNNTPTHIELRVNDRQELVLETRDDAV